MSDQITQSKHDLHDNYWIEIQNIWQYVATSLYVLELIHLFHCCLREEKFVDKIGENYYLFAWNPIV